MKLHRLAVSVAGLAFLAFATFSLAAHAQDLPSEGIYKGEITVAHGAPVQISMQLRFSDSYAQPDPGDAFPTKKQVICTFTIEDEAGPYNMSYAVYNIEKGYFDMFYVRPGLGSSSGQSSGGSTGGSSGGAGSASSSPPSVYSLHFPATFKAGVISGELDSGLRGSLGQFSLKHVSNGKVLAVQPRIGIGSFEGPWQYAGNPADKADLYLSASGVTQINPSDLELENTPGRIGSVILNDISIIPFSQVYMDYFTHSVRMLYSNQTNGASVSVSGTIDDSIITGTGVSGYNAKPAQFKVTRIKL